MCVCPQMYMYMYNVIYMFMYMQERKTRELGKVSKAEDRPFELKTKLEPGYSVMVTMVVMMVMVMMMQMMIG